MRVREDSHSSRVTDAVAEIAPSRFRHVLGHFPTGVTVITALDDDRPVGLAVGSFFSLSLEPALVGFCAARTSSSWPGVRRAGQFSANVLAADQESVCQQFARSGGDKFGGLEWVPGATGAPVLPGALAHVDCTIEDVHAGGDHEICIGRVVDLAVRRDCAPLLFFRGGHAIA